LPNEKAVQRPLDCGQLASRRSNNVSASANISPPRRPDLVAQMRSHLGGLRRAHRRDGHWSRCSWPQLGGVGAEQLLRAIRARPATRSSLMSATKAGNARRQRWHWWRSSPPFRSNRCDSPPDVHTLFRATPYGPTVNAGGRSSTAGLVVGQWPLVKIVLAGIPVRAAGHWVIQVRWVFQPLLVWFTRRGAHRRRLSGFGYGTRLRFAGVRYGRVWSDGVFGHAGLEATRVPRSAPPLNSPLAWGRADRFDLYDCRA
jgi:hypothetical protein